MTTVALWFGGVLLALIFSLLFYTFPRGFGSLVIGVLLVVARHQVFPWLGIDISLHGSGNLGWAICLFWTWFLILCIIGWIIDISHIREDEAWF
ncbi:MAG: hypothetical protein Q8P49_03505 [Candidatus Liptonbacteria bacterium]|nr:hypothetical protein [Candidatus Liptonbacteria bacterium]